MQECSHWMAAVTVAQHACSPGLAGCEVDPFSNECLCARLRFPNSRHLSSEAHLTCEWALVPVGGFRLLPQIIGVQRATPFLQLKTLVPWVARGSSLPRSPVAGGRKHSPGLIGWHLQYSYSQTAGSFSYTFSLQISQVRFHHQPLCRLSNANLSTGIGKSVGRDCPLNALTQRLSAG